MTWIQWYAAAYMAIVLISFGMDLEKDKHFGSALASSFLVMPILLHVLGVI